MSGWDVVKREPRKPAASMSAWPKEAIRIPVPVYNQSIWFIQDRKVWADCMEYATGTRPALDGLLGRCTSLRDRDDSSLLLLLCVHDHDVGTLAHEAVHAALEILENAGVNLRPVDEETLAYLVGFIFDRCREHMVDAYRG